jgi:hypothetical protein
VDPVPKIYINEENNWINEGGIEKNGGENCIIYSS